MACVPRCITEYFDYKTITWLLYKIEFRNIQRILSAADTINGFIRCGCKQQLVFCSTHEQFWIFIKAKLRNRPNELQSSILCNAFNDYPLCIDRDIIYPRHFHDRN